MLRPSIVVLALALCGCGDDPKDPPSDTPLPRAPQILPNPSGILIFPLTEANDVQGAELPVALGNGGQQDLVIDAVTLVGETTTGIFTLDALTDNTVASRGTVLVPIHFNPTARGVYLATLRVTSNAANTPTLDVALVGPAATSLLGNQPDLAAFEDVAYALPDYGQGRLVFARLINLGPGLVHLTSYGIVDDLSDAFALHPDVVQPSSQCAATCPVSALPAGCEPVSLGSGDFVVLPIVYTPAGNGTHTATFTVSSDDPGSCPLEIGLSGTTP